MVSDTVFLVLVTDFKEDSVSLRKVLHCTMRLVDDGPNHVGSELLLFLFPVKLVDVYLSVHVDLLI